MIVAANKNRRNPIPNHKNPVLPVRSFAIAVALIFAFPGNGTPEQPFAPDNLPIKNSSGFHARFSTQGSIDLRNEFFQSLGTNGRTCVSCHRSEEGWSITPTEVQQRFERREGSDAIFRVNDGKRRTPDMPLYTLRNKTSGAIELTTDRDARW